MATTRKLPSKRWYVEVRKYGQRKSKTFDSKLQAIQWADEIEQTIDPDSLMKVKHWVMHSRVTVMKSLPPRRVTAVSLIALTGFYAILSRSSPLQKSVNITLRLYPIYGLGVCLTRLIRLSRVYGVCYPAHNLL